MQERRRIAVVTGTRAEYGLLKGLLKALESHDAFDMHLLVTGSHLSEKFGNTYKEIEADELPIFAKVDLQLGNDDPSAICEASARAITGFSDIFCKEKYDLLLLLGDRYELLSAAFAAMIHRLPIGHIHGGEVTEGAMDEGIRHSITKMSHVHFVAAEEYRRRVVQLGENPATVFNVGGLGVDAIKSTKLMSRHELESDLGIKFGERNLLVTYHLVTLEPNAARHQIDELVTALETFADTSFIITLPNADTENQVLFDRFKSFESGNPNATCFASLGQLRYYSCVAQVDAVVGNSSSGLLEIPSFRKATVNIGDRQKGRLKATTVIDCDPVAKDIIRALERVYSEQFQSEIQSATNPYGNGGAVRAITLETAIYSL